MKLKENKWIVLFLIICSVSLVAGCVFSRVASKRAAEDERVAKEEGLKLISTVYFATNSVGILPSSASVLDQDVRWLAQNRDVALVLEGHCDNRGSEAYNKELGDRRARSVRAYLLSKGVSKDRIAAVISYGETKPADVRNTPEAWRKNRRVELVPR
ncbi:MAG: OmpA family protein [Pseudomonadota bacterium]